MVTSHNDEEVRAILNNRILKDKDATNLVLKAWHFAKDAHGQQQRHSGEPHTEHLFETARYLSNLGLEATTISAGILHDTLEDTATTEKDLKREFGDDIAFLVIGVTKLEKQRHGLEIYQAENLRRLFISASKDPRVLVIKLCDRLHNMNTLQYLPPKKRTLIARETLDIYVPVAERFGMNVMKRKMEDLAFKHINPEVYKENDAIFKKELSLHLPLFNEATEILQVHLSDVCSFPINIVQRIKGKYSFHKKLIRKKGVPEAVNDIVIIQVIVPNTIDCYSALGNIHSLWHPIPKKLKDYIAFPKPNGYQCLNTTVDAGKIGIIEIQIYSKDMYAWAQYGIVTYLIHNEQSIKPNKIKYFTKKFLHLLKNISKHIPHTTKGAFLHTKTAK